MAVFADYTYHLSHYLLRVFIYFFISWVKILLLNTRRKARVLKFKLGTYLPRPLREPFYILPEFIDDSSKRSNTNPCRYTHADIITPNILQIVALV